MLLGSRTHAYKVVLESLDEIEGTVHLRADLQMPASAQLLSVVDVDEVKKSVPPQTGNLLEDMLKNSESGVLPIGRSPSRWEEKKEPQQDPEARDGHDSSYLI